MFDHTEPNKTINKESSVISNNVPLFVLCGLAVILFSNLREKTLVISLMNFDHSARHVIRRNKNYYSLSNKIIVKK